MAYGPMNIEVDSRSQQQLGTLVKLVGSVAGIALIFYLLGFTVVQSYFYGNNLEGFFVLSHEFYEAAGIEFLIEVLRAPLWSPLLVGPYLLLLILLIPRPAVKLDMRFIGIARVGVFLALLISTYVYCLFYNRAIDTRWFVLAVDALVLDPSKNDDQTAKLAFGFFALATPMVIAGWVLLWRFRVFGVSRTLAGYFYKSVAYIYVAFLAMLPIAFGFHVYDWKLVQVNDPAGVGGLLSKQERSSGLFQVWLVGKFGERFVFVKSDGLAEYAVIAALEEKAVKTLTLETNEINYLKVVLNRGTHTGNKRGSEKNLEGIIQQFESKGEYQFQETK